MKKIIIPAFAALLFASCEGDSTEPLDTNTDPVAIEAEQVDKGYFSGNPVSAGNFVINTNTEWEVFVSMVNTIYDGESEPLQGVMPNLENHTVIAVLDEWHESGGYTIDITSITGTEESVMVDVENTGPGEGAVTAVVTQPYHIVKIPKTTLPVTFE